MYHVNTVTRPTNNVLGRLQVSLSVEASKMMIGIIGCYTNYSNEEILLR
jgi:hypothetical protein